MMLFLSTNLYKTQQAKEAEQAAAERQIQAPKITSAVLQHTFTFLSHRDRQHAGMVCRDWKGAHDNLSKQFSTMLDIFEKEIDQTNNSELRKRLLAAIDKFDGDHKLTTDPIYQSLLKRMKPFYLEFALHMFFIRDIFHNEKLIRDFCAKLDFTPPVISQVNTSIKTLLDKIYAKLPTLPRGPLRDLTLQCMILAACILTPREKILSLIPSTDNIPIGSILSVILSVWRFGRATLLTGTTEKITSELRTHLGEVFAKELLNLSNQKDSPIDIKAIMALTKDAIALTHKVTEKYNVDNPFIPPLLLWALPHLEKLAAEQSQPADEKRPSFSLRRN